MSAFPLIAILSAVAAKYGRDSKELYSASHGAKLLQRMSNPELSERELAGLCLMAQSMGNRESVKRGLVSL